MLCRLVGLLVRSLVFFLLLFCFSFASLQGLEFKHSGVIVGRICPLVDVEAGFIILNLKKSSLNIVMEKFARELHDCTLLVGCFVFFFCLRCQLAIAHCVITHQ
jgi:hypothetical protein